MNSHVVGLWAHFATKRPPRGTARGGEALYDHTQTLFTDVRSVSTKFRFQTPKLSERPKTQDKKERSRKPALRIPKQDRFIFF
jgi:hypothetical protein